MTIAATDETTSPPSFQEAFAQAKEEHSPKAAAAVTEEHAPPSKASTDEPSETDTTTTSAGATSTTTAEKPAETGLLTDDEFTALTTTHADDPAALRKALEGAFTKKTQTLAEQRRSYERLSQYTDIIDAYESDAVATIEALAEQHGMKLVRPGAAATPATEEPPASADAETTQAAIQEAIRAELGDELEYLSDPVARAITKAVEAITKRTVDAATEPLKAQADAQRTKTAEAETASVMKTFGDQHPDWTTHEPAMLKLAAQIAPKGMSELEYLNHLYETVTAPARTKLTETEIEKRVAAGVKSAVAKMQQGADTTEPATGSVPDNQVSKRPPGTPGFRDAFEAAKRGERWE